jgi:hypothetical protein
MAWLTNEWVAAHAEVWGSASVIITSIDNVVNQCEDASHSSTYGRWLIKAVEAGFKGVVLIDYDFDYVPTTYNLSCSGTFYKEYYEYMTRDADYLLGSPTAQDSKYILDPSNFKSNDDNEYGRGLISIYKHYIDKLANSLPADADVTFGFLLNYYEHLQWKPGEDYPTGVGDTYDPFTVGTVYDSQSNGELADFNTYYDNIITAFDEAGLLVVAKGDRILDEADIGNSLLNSKELAGIFLDDVTTATVGAEIANATSYRTAMTPADTTESLLLIAGIKNNPPQGPGGGGSAPTPVAYANMIQQIINAGLYFTPGANGSYFNYPAVGLDDWWIRVDDDEQWQDDPNNPTYASVTVHPRKIFNVTPTDYSNAFTYTGFGGGGQLHSMAIHPTNKLIAAVGGDNMMPMITYNNGLDFTPIFDGWENRAEFSYQMYYVSDIVGVDNDIFSGFIFSSFGGIFSLELNSDTFTWMTDMLDDYWYVVTDATLTRLKYSIEFSSIASDGNEFLVAGAGRVRLGSESTYEQRYYPDGARVINEDSSDDCPFGYYSVWRYYFDDAVGESKWRPMKAIGDRGAIRDISVTTAGADTLIAFTAVDGVYYWNGTNNTVIQLDNNDVERNGSPYNFTINGSADHVTHNIVITPRRTIYMSVENRDSAIDLHSGVFKFHDALVTDGTWQWVGDGANKEFFGNTSMWDQGRGSGAAGSVQWAFMQVLPGNVAAPDTVYSCYRSGTHTGYPIQSGLHYTFSPYDADSKQQESWQGLMWRSSTDNTPGLLSNSGTPSGGWGWARRNTGATITGAAGVNKLNWGMEASNEPAVMTGGKVYYQPNGRLYRSDNYGQFWNNAYCKKSPTGADYWKSNGYIQSVVAARGMALWDDNRLIISSADHGLKISETSNWEYFAHINPPVESVSSQTEGKVWTSEGGPIYVIDNWNGTGRKALFYVVSDIIGLTKPSRILIWHDANGDGTPTWTEPTQQVTDPEYYVIDDITIIGTRMYVAYRLYDDVVGGGGSRSDWGVYYQDWSGSWSNETFWNTGLTVNGSDNTDRTNIWITAIDQTTLKVWITMRASGVGSGNGGALYRSTVAGNWIKVIGYGSSYTADRDIWSMEVSGDEIWVGTKGHDNRGVGTVYYCADAAASPAVWSKIFNNDVVDVLLEGAANLSRSAEYEFTNNELERNKTLTMIQGLYYDSDDELWIGIQGLKNKMPWYAGVYRWDLSANRPVDLVNTYYESFIGTILENRVFYRLGNSVIIGCNPGLIKIDMSQLP